MSKKSRVGAASDPVYAAAECVRQVFEKIAEEEHGPSDLGGMCGRAAVQVWLEAKRRGVKGMKLVLGCFHAFCSTSDGRIVDVTATQFKDGYENIVVDQASADPPEWHQVRDSWDSVREWLDDTRAGSLFGARRMWKEDLKLMESTR